MEYSAGMKALKCQYCSTVTEIPNENEEMLAEVVDVVVPLTVERNDLIDAVYQHIASGKYTPDNLLEHATFSKVERMYVPAYVYMGSYEAEWTASFGYDRTEHFTVYERDSQGNSRPVNKTKTVTDWRPVNGSDSGEFSAVGYAGELLDGSPLKPFDIVEFNRGLGEPKPYDSSYLSGLESEAFVVLESDVFSRRAEPQIERIIERSVKQHAQGEHQRDWHWKQKISKVVRTALVPICHVVYEYDGKAHHVWMDGTDTNHLLSDPLPVDTERMKTVQMSFVPVGVAAVALPLAGLMSGGGVMAAVSWFTVGVVAAAGAYGWFRREAILDYSSELRRSLLSQRKASSTNVSSLTEAERNELVESVKRPTKSWIADTARDKIVLPAVSVALAAAVLVPGLVGKPGTTQSYDTSAKVSQNITNSQNSSRVSNTAASPVNPAAPEQVPVQTQQAAAVQPEPAAQAQQAVVAPANPVQTLPNTAPVVELLKSAAANNWSLVDMQVAAIRSSMQPISQGDRKTARAANAEGLAALNQQRYDQAIAAFGRGIIVDASDTEVLNNLGYSQLLAGRYNEGVDSLLRVLARVPDRSSGWANLGEGLSRLDNEGGSLAALRIAVRFSANRDKTIEYLKRTSDSHSSLVFRNVASRVLNEINSIPANPSALVQPSRAVATPQIIPQTQVARIPPPAPAPVAPQVQVPVSSSPQASCEGRPNFISKSICDARECAKPEFRSSAYCVRVIEAANRVKPYESTEGK